MGNDSDLTLDMSPAYGDAGIAMLAGLPPPRVVVAASVLSVLVASLITQYRLH